MTVRLRLPSSKIPLYDFQIRYYIKRSKVPNFRGIFCRDTLPPKVRINECGIINLDLSTNGGTHWVAYSKRGNIVHYFDPLGNVPPPPTALAYFGKNVTVLYNHNAAQTLNSVNCGHCCIKFLVSTTTKKKKKKKK